MDTELTSEQRAAQAAFRAFVDQQIAPQADRIDRDERLPAELIAALAREGYLGAAVPAAFGGGALDMITACWPSSSGALPPRSTRC